MDLAEPWRFISYFMNFSAAALSRVDNARKSSDNESIVKTGLSPANRPLRHGGEMTRPLGQIQENTSTQCPDRKPALTLRARRTDRRRS